MQVNIFFNSEFFSNALNKFLKTIRILMKVSVSVKYFLVSWIVKHIQLGPNIQNPLSRIMDYLRMDGKQYASKVRNKALEDFDWLSQWLE